MQRQDRGECQSLFSGKGGKLLTGLLLSSVVLFLGSAALACEINQVTPNQGLQGEVLEVTLDGVGFSYSEFYEVSFGPGIEVEVLNMLPIAVEPIPETLQLRLSISETAAPGPRTIVVNGYVASCTAENAFTVGEAGPQENQLPVADFVFAPAKPCAGSEVAFDASASYDPDGEIVSYLWNFGDGTGGEGLHVGHTYEEPNEYTVTLEVVDDEGEAGGMALLIVVEECEELGFDYGDAPARDVLQPFSSLDHCPPLPTPCGYRTLKVDDGAYHVINPFVRLGPSHPDGEFDGQPTFSATGDDLTNIDDEDGIDFRSGVMLVRDRNFDYPSRMFTYYMMAQGTTVCLKPLATASGHFSGWIDWNRNLDWEDSEQIFGAEPIVSGPDYSQLCFGVPSYAEEGYTYGRFRFSTKPVSSPYGKAEDGEVEDYLFLVVHSIDAGDAPDDENLPRYPTLLSHGGAFHRITSLKLGSFIDAEPDGQPSADAMGDDMDVPTQPDDEDGVWLNTALVPGQPAQITVNVQLPGNPPEAGKLDAWVDFNRDGDWDDPGEQIFTSEPLAAGDNILTFTVPTNAATGQTFARFRLSSAGGLQPTGFALDGEVEDYAWTLGEQPSPICGMAGSDKVIDGADLIRAIQAYARGEIDGAQLIQVIQYYASGTACDQPLPGASAAAATTVPFALESVGYSGQAFVAEGVGIAAIEAQVYDLAGRVVFSSAASGNTLAFTEMNNQGKPLANGVYLYHVVVHGIANGLWQSEVRKLIILR